MNEAPVIVVNHTISGRKAILAWALLVATCALSYEKGKTAGYNQAYAASRASVKDA